MGDVTGRPRDQLAVRIGTTLGSLGGEGG